MITKNEKIKFINSMCNNSMSILKVSKELFLHVNSIAYRCYVIKKETGLDPRIYNDLKKLEKIYYD